jgi:hypothetical protein
MRDLFTLPEWLQIQLSAIDPFIVFNEKVKETKYGVFLPV